MSEAASEQRIAVMGLRNANIGYGEVTVLPEMNLSVHAGEMVGLLGPNGAGKSTTLLALAGGLKPKHGDIIWQGSPTTAPMHKRCREGLSFVTEERSVFMGMTAMENLRVGRCDIDYALELLPELVPHLNRRVGLLSGGQQQILTLARALARRTTALLTDAFSLGLAPLIVDRLLRALREATRSGLAVLLVEQQIHKAIEFCDRIYILSGGQVSFEGSAAEAKSSIAGIEESYFTARTVD